MSTNVSKEKREKLLSEIEEIRKTLIEKHDDNTDRLLVYLSDIEKDINGKKYGLVFEEHREAVDELLEKNVPVLVENEDLKIDNGGTQNFLIEGDNLASLKLLEKTHKGKIDLIYIDPPYNTGNKDFVYDDAFVDSEDKFKHSKWLSFMSERLKIAHRLLSDKGVIFISIDNNEQAQLKILCDNVFNDNNYIGTMIWRKKAGGGQTDEFFVTEHEYILCYRKAFAFKWLNFQEEAKIEDFKLKDNYGNYTLVKLEKWGSSAHKEDRPSMYFSIKAPDKSDYFPKAPDGKDGRWRVGLQKMTEIIKQNNIYWSFDKKKNSWIPYEKVYFNELKGKLIKSRSIIYDLAETGDATKQLTEVFGTKDLFQNPKPVELIQFLIKHCNCSIVLDFFAGSGTTGHAVMKLNAEDGGKRKFILCTNNENNICRDVTYERIKRVIAKEDYKASLKYYKVDFVPISEQLYYEYADKLLLHIKELVELENGLDFAGNNKVAICLTDDELKTFADSINGETAYKAVYVGHDVFVTPETEDKLTSHNVNINVIPDYYYGELRG